MLLLIGAPRVRTMFLYAMSSGTRKLTSWQPGYPICAPLMMMAKCAQNRQMRTKNSVFAYRLCFTAVNQK